MKRRLAASEGDSERAEAFQFSQLRFEGGEGNRFARFVELGAISAGKIAAADDHHLDQERTVAEAE